MAATLQILPPNVALSQEPLIVRVQTNNVNISKAILDIYFTASLADGDSLTITWSGITVVFVFKTNPDGSGLQLPITINSSDYLAQLCEYLRRNDAISSDYVVAYSVFTSQIRLTARVSKTTIIVATTTSAGITVTPTNSYGIYVSPNLNVSSSKAILDVFFTGSPSDGDSLTIAWYGITAVFFFRDSPNNGGSELPIAAITSDYLAELCIYFRRNNYIDNDYILTYSASTSQIRLTARVSQARTIIAHTTSIFINANSTNSTDSYAQANLTALLKVLNPDESVIARLNGNYILNSDGGTTIGICDFDLANVFDIATHCPNDSSLSATSTVNYEIANTAFTNYKLRYADKYGIPSVSEGLQVSDVFHVIYGGHSIASTKTFTPNEFGIYLCQPNSVSCLTRNQPAYLNIYTTQNFTNVNLQLHIKLKTGEVGYDFVVGNAFNIEAFKVYMFRIGLNQLDLSSFYTTMNITGDDILSYEFTIVEYTDTITAKLMHSVLFNDDCRYNSLFLLFGNGLGGVSSLHVHGGYAQRSEIEQTLITQYSLNKTDPRAGNFTNIFATINDVWDVETGLITADYARELRQLFLSDLWLIDLENNRFLKVFNDTKNIQTKPKRDGMVSLAMTFKASWKDKNAV